MEAEFNPLDNAEKARELVLEHKGYGHQDPRITVQNVLSSLGLGSNKIEHGKVTTSVSLKNGWRIHIRRPDISTHDVLRGLVPFKEQYVNLINNKILEVIDGIPESAQFKQSFFGLSNQSPVTVQEDCTLFGYEHILRGYLSKTSTRTSLYYRYFIEGYRDFCGHQFPDGLIPNQKLNKIYDTPSTKGKHDESVSAEYLFHNNIVDREVYKNILLPASLEAYEKVSRFLEPRKMVLMDTKLEFGINKVTGNYNVVDECFTLDSSRFCRVDTNGEIVCDPETNEPIQFSKEFARNLAKGAQAFSEEELNQIATQGILSVQLITGQVFQPLEGSFEDLVHDGIKKVISNMS